MAAGTIARQYTHVYGDIPIDGIEIDPGIVAAGDKYFEMDTMPNLTVYVEDGRYMLNKLNKQYTVVGIDAYRPPYIPWHLTTVEFFRGSPHASDRRRRGRDQRRAHHDRPPPDRRA